MNRSFLAVPLFLATVSNAQVVINEVDYDQPGTDNAEYIEIKNIGTSAYPMQYLTVLLINGNSGAGVQYASISDPSWQPLAPGGYFVICGNQSLTLNCDHPGPAMTNLVQNGPMDAIVLIDVNDEVIDVLSYDGTLPGYVEGTGTPVGDTNIQDGISLCRWPDGGDTGDNSVDFVIGCPTPGAMNVLDPVECALTTGISAPAMANGLTVIPDAQGTRIDLRWERATAVPVQVSIHGMDGRCIDERTFGATASVNWSIGTVDRGGQMLLVRVVAGGEVLSRRILIP